MTLTTQINTWEYLGDGVSTEFAYTARVDLSTDMVAVIDGVAGSIGYSVTGLGDDAGGLVIFNTPPADQANISLERLLPLQQTTDYPVRGPFPAKDHEGTLDRIVMMLQQQRTALLDVYGYLGIGNGGGTIFPLGGQVPKGLIAEWAGAPVTIPSGWFLCDGTNGTPDLSGRFVVCLDEDGTVFNNVGDIGGENEVVLTTNQMPNHEHDITPADATVLSTPGTSTTTGGSQLQASLSVDGVTGHSQAVGVAEAHNNVPVYYTLAYIQYQGGQSAPSFIGTFPNQIFSEGEVVSIDMSTEFFVGDGSNPIYTAIGLPPGITIDPVSGVISGTVAAGASASSPYSVTVTLTTGINPPATSFPVSVWTITTFPALGVGSSIWLNPTGITKSGSNITGWDNDVIASNPGGDLTNLSNTMPEATVNSLDVVSSANTSPRYQKNIVPYLQPSGFTMYVVGGFDAHTNDPASLVLGDPVNDIQIENAAGNIQIRGNAIGVLSQMAEDTNGHVWAIRSDSGNYRSRISGDPANWVTDATIIDQGFEYISILNDTNNLNTQAVGWVGEVLLYPAAHSDAQMDDIYAELLAKWGI